MHNNYSSVIYLLADSSTGEILSAYTKESNVKKAIAQLIQEDKSWEKELIKFHGDAMALCQSYEWDSYYLGFHYFYTFLGD